MSHVEITQHEDGSWVQRTLSRVPKRMEHSGALLMTMTRKDSYCFLLLKAPNDDFSYFTCIIPVKQVKRKFIPGQTIGQCPGEVTRTQLPLAVCAKETKILQQDEAPLSSYASTLAACHRRKEGN